MSSQLKIRRGTRAQNAAFTGAQSELIHETDDGRVIIHDGQRPGGSALGFLEEVSVPFSNYAALRSYTDGRIATVRIQQKNQSGFFAADPADTTSEDDGGCTIVSENGMRWKRIFNGSVLVDWYGADPTKVADSLSAFTAAIATGKSVYAPGKYYCSGSVSVVKSQRLHGDGQGTSAANSVSTIEFAAGSDGVILDSEAASIDGICLSSRTTVETTGRGLIIKRGRSVAERVLVTKFGLHGVAIDSTGPTNANLARLTNVRSFLNKGDGFRTEGGVDINNCTIESCDATANGGWGYYTNGSAKTVFINPHAAGNVLGGYYDRGSSSTYIAPYTEGGTGGTFFVAIGSSWGTVIMGVYGAPSITFEATSVATSWNVIQRGVFVGRFRLLDVAGYDAGKRYEFINDATGFKITNATDSKTIIDVDHAATRVYFGAPPSPSNDLGSDLGLASRRWKDFRLGGTLYHSGTSLGFYSKTPVAQPVVTAAATDAATTQTLVNSIRTALINLGLVV